MIDKYWFSCELVYGVLTMLEWRPIYTFNIQKQLFFVTYEFFKILLTSKRYENTQLIFFLTSHSRLEVAAGF